MQPETKSFLWVMACVALGVVFLAALAVQSDDCDRRCAPDEGRLVRGVVWYECICGGEP